MNHVPQKHILTLLLPVCELQTQHVKYEPLYEPNCVYAWWAPTHLLYSWRSSMEKSQWREDKSVLLLKESIAIEPLHREDSQNKNSERHVLPFGIRPMLSSQGTVSSPMITIVCVQEIPFFFWHHKPIFTIHDSYSQHLDNVCLILVFLVAL